MSSKFFKLMILCLMIVVKRLKTSVTVSEQFLLWRIPVSTDYFILPRSLYKNLQKWTSAMSSFEICFRSSFEKLFLFGEYACFLDVFSISFTEWWFILLTAWIFLSEYSCLKIFFSIDLFDIMFLGEIVLSIILIYFPDFIVEFSFFSLKILHSGCLKLNFINSSGSNLAFLSWFRALVKNYFAIGENYLLLMIVSIFSPSIFFNNYFSFLALHGVSHVNISKKIIPIAQISVLNEYSFLFKD